MADNRSKLAKTMSRLFSSNVVVRNIGDNKLKVVDPSRIQTLASKYMKNRYTGLHHAGGGNRGMHSSMGYGDHIGFLAQRIALFRDYEAMDRDAIISSALDIYADEAVTADEYGDVLTVDTEDTEVKDILKNLFYDVLNIEFNLRWWVRSMVKYGDCFLKLDVSNKYGIVNAQALSVYETTRVEGDNPENPMEITFEYEGAAGAEKLEFWQCAHFRFLQDGNYLPYGKSGLEGARRAWKQITLMEDAMIIHRVMRAPERRVFRIDVGNIPPESIDTFMNQTISNVRKTPLIDPQTGDYNLKFNLMNMIEDFYLPVRGDRSGTEIDTLTGMQYDAINDIEYIRNKMMTALRVPNAFLGYERDLQGKATLAQQEIKFANQVKYIQQVMVSELYKIAMVHLYALGIRDERLTKFKLKLTNPSTVQEQEYIELLSRKADLARTFEELPYFSSDWIFKNIFNMSDKEIKSARREKVRDWQRKFRREQIEREGNDPVKTGQSFGTPADLALSGARELKPLSLELEKRNAEREEAFKKKERKGAVNDPTGKEAMNNANDRRVTRGDYTHTYKGGSPLALDNMDIPTKSRKLIHESIEPISEELDNFIDIEYEELDDGIPENSYMNENVLLNVDDND